MVFDKRYLIKSISAVTNYNSSSCLIHITPNFKNSLNYYLPPIQVHRSRIHPLDDKFHCFDKDKDSCSLSHNYRGDMDHHIWSKIFNESSNLFNPFWLVLDMFMRIDHLVRQRKYRGNISHVVKDCQDDKVKEKWMLIHTHNCVTLDPPDMNSIQHMQLDRR